MSEEDFAWWSKGKKGKNGLQKAGFRSYQHNEGAGKDYVQNKGKRKAPKKIGKEEAHPQSGLSASETPNDWSSSHRFLDSRCWVVLHKGSYCMDGNPLNFANHATHVVLDLGCTKSIGSRSPIEIFKKHAYLLTLRLISAVVRCSSCLPTR